MSEGVVKDNPWYQLGVSKRRIAELEQQLSRMTQDIDESSTTRELLDLLAVECEWAADVVRRRIAQKNWDIVQQVAKNAALKQQLADLREYAFVCIEMQRAGLPTNGAIASMEAAIKKNKYGS